VEGGCANDYDYVCGDPINQFDLTGLWCALGTIKYRDSDGETHKKCRGAGVAKQAVDFVSDNRHRIVDAAVGTASAFVVGACIASVGCGVTVAAIGLGAVFVEGTIAHVAVATAEERASQGFGTDTLARTGKSVVTGGICGYFFDRGCAFGVALGGKPGTPGERSPSG